MVLQRDLRGIIAIVIVVVVAPDQQMGQIPPQQFYIQIVLDSSRSRAFIVFRAG
jgi:hypothetical protein